MQEANASEMLAQLASRLSLGTDDAPITPGKLEDPLHLLATIESLTRGVSKLLRQIYEIEEVRHASSSNHATQLDALLSKLDSGVTRLAPQIDAVTASVRGYVGGDEGAIRESLEELQEEWARASGQYAMLKEEMKEDGWLVRFRATAEQAEGMMGSLEKSLVDCSHYVERISSSPVPVPYDSELDELPSISTLQIMMKRHDALRNTYLASIAKILKMTDKSIADRPTMNGEALRRYSEMCTRFARLQRGLQQLEARVRIVLSQHHGSPTDNVEVLIDVSNPNSPTGEYFGMPDKRPEFSHRSSISSGTSRSTRQSPLYSKPAAQFPAGPPEQRNRQPSFSRTVSTTHTSTERPPWNGSTRVETDNTRTLSNRQLGSYGAMHRAVSPSPSATSAAAGALGTQGSKPAAPTSRIPVMSPRSRTTSSTSSHNIHMTVPSLSVSTSHGQHFLTDADDLPRMKTPEPRLRTVSSVTPRSSSTLTPMGIAGHRGVAGPAPRTAPAGRASLSRAPPSSFRSPTPTPSGVGRASSSRPASRMSMASYAVHPSVPLQPFVPSPYDLLDQQVHSLLLDTGFNLLVSRLDSSMKRGQRRAENEEWKGEYVFGAGEKASAVKLVQIAARGAHKDKERRVKCMVRVGGAWVDLKGVLETRMTDRRREGSL